MNSVHLHLISSHAPVMGTLFGLILLVWGVACRKQDFQRLALWIFVGAGLVALVAYLSGPPAAEVLVRLMPGTAHDASDQHADIAVLALAGALVLGLAALSGLAFYRKGRKWGGGYIALILLLAVLSSGLSIWTANLGGRIRHLEIRPQATAPVVEGIEVVIIGSNRLVSGLGGILDL